MAIVTGKKYQFESIYEPSGVQQLEDGRVIVVEDERTNPLSILSFDSNGQTLSHYLSESEASNQIIGHIEDIEGVAVDEQNKIYIISSQSTDSRGKREDERERLARFVVKGKQVCGTVLKEGLRKAILNHYTCVKKQQKKDPLNIESLDYDSTNQRLLIGLRSPLIDDRAVLLSIDNPADVFMSDTDFKFGKKPILLDLDGGGLRSMVFVKQLNGYLLVSRKKGKQFKLWFCRQGFESKPQQIKIDLDKDLANAEGICPVIIAGESLLLLVFDDGDKQSQKGAHYAFLAYEQLTINESG